MPFEMEPTERNRSLWPFLVAGAVIVVVVLVAFGLFSSQPAGHAPAARPLPFGSAEQGYAPNVQFQNLHMSRFANMLHQQVTYVMGDINNSGNRTIGDLEITLEFKNVQGQVVYRRTVRPLEPNPMPIGPGQRRSFDLGFDQVPDDWNEAYPTIRVTGLVLQ